MRLPSSEKCGMPKHSPVSALWFAARLLRAQERPVFIGKLATMMNRKLKQWKKPGSFMEASVARFTRPGHANSLPDYLPTSIEVVRGKDGVPRGHILLRAV